MFWIVVGIVAIVINVLVAWDQEYLFTWTWLNGLVIGLWICEVLHDINKRD